MQKTPTIFLSYCRANADVADSIDNDFRSIGITFRRDIRDVPYKGNIKDFMNKIGESDYVLMLISDEFLKSDWCMYEVTELLNTYKFDDKILPVLLDNANHIFKEEARDQYYDFWDGLVEENKNRSTRRPNIDVIETGRRYKNVANHLDSFFLSIVELNLLAIGTLKEQNYRPILDLVGFEDKLAIEEILAIWQIEDEEEKEMMMDEYVLKYPSNHYYYFSKAFFAANNRKFKMARKAYERALLINPEYADAYNNLGKLLEEQFSDYQYAKACYENALCINPEYAFAHNNLGALLQEHFSDYEGAKSSYNRALQINPEYASAYYNLGVLLDTHFSDFEGARSNYEIALSINPENTNAHYNLGVVLTYCFFDYKRAKLCYEKALSLNPEDADANYNLAILYKDFLNNNDKARSYYTIAVQLDSSLIDEGMDKFFGIKR